MHKCWPNASCVTAAPYRLTVLNLVCARMKLLAAAAARAHHALHCWASCPAGAALPIALLVVLELDSWCEFRLFVQSLPGHGNHGSSGIRRPVGPPTRPPCPRLPVDVDAAAAARHRPGAAGRSRAVEPAGPPAVRRALRVPAGTGLDHPSGAARHLRDGGRLRGAGHRCRDACAGARCVQRRGSPAACVCLPEPESCSPPLPSSTQHRAACEQSASYTPTHVHGAGRLCCRRRVVWRWIAGGNAFDAAVATGLCLWHTECGQTAPGAECVARRRGPAPPA